MKVSSILVLLFQFFYSSLTKKYLIPLLFYAGVPKLKKSKEYKFGNAFSF